MKISYVFETVKFILTIFNPIYQNVISTCSNIRCIKGCYVLFSTVFQIQRGFHIHGQGRHLELLHLKGAVSPRPAATSLDRVGREPEKILGPYVLAGCSQDPVRLEGS